jgi:hypothetical protein
MITDVEDLLNRAAAAPLGPLSLSYDRADDAWILKVTYAGRQITGLKAIKDGATGGICLEYQTPSGDACDLSAFLDSRSWVSAVASTPAGSTILRIWLHGDGLQVNTLLSLSADLARLSSISVVADPVSQEASGLAESAVEVPLEPELPVPIEAKPEPARPAPIPVAPRPVGWQSFGVPASATPAKADEAMHESEPPAIAASGAEVSSGSSTAAESAKTHAAPASTDDAPLSSQSVPPPPTAEVDPPVLPKPAGTAGFCRECGSAFAPDHAFCTTCGARLN